MKYLLLVLLLCTFSLLMAIQTDNCLTLPDRVQVSLSQIRTAPALQEEEDSPTLITRTYALPYEHFSLNVTAMNWKEYDLSGNYLRSYPFIDSQALYVSNSFTFREMRGVTLNIRNQVREGDRIRIMDSAEYEIVGNSVFDIPQSVSPAFINAYRKLADNYDYSYLRNLPVSRPGLLIISQSALASYVSSLANWKRAQGFEVYVVNRQDIGNDVQAIKAYILNHYNQYHCDYLLLLGDVSGSFTIPTNIFTSPDGTENDADDNFYTMLTGDDYFPEMIPGRFSFNDLSEYQTIANKTIYYEKNPYMTSTAWMSKALVVAGNYAEGSLQPVTPINTSRWLREKLLAKGYTQVDTVFSPPTYPGSSAIQTSLNAGVQFVSYRGWGDANGWHYPYFHIQELAATTNGPKMPYVFSIVCNTGDFANNINPCFGEKWMRMGSPSVPSGCVAFVGPSDLHTKTNLNNVISSGAYSAIFDDGERSFGAAVLAGKVELYINNPNELAPNQNIAFYFHVYNVLSDPSLNMWVLVPNTIPSSVLTNGTSFPQSASFIPINAPGLDGANVTGTKNNTDYSITTIRNGVAYLPIDPAQTGDLKLTISKPNYVPLVVTLTPTASQPVNVIYNSLANAVLNPGQSHQLTVSVKSFSTTALSNIAANLAAIPAEYVTISNPSQTITSLQPDATTTLTYNLTINGSVPLHQVIRFELNFPGQSAQYICENMTGGAEFVLTTPTLNLPIGTAANVTFTVQNTGSIALQNATVNIHSNTDAAVINTPVVVVGDIGLSNPATFNASITVQNGCYTGRLIPLEFTFTNDQDYSELAYYSLTAGNPSTTDPTGPDPYGYFAYDNFDMGYSQHPVYDWVEIDPTEGGNGTVWEIIDDGSITVNLPFTVRYYGRNYNSLTICSNGWVSFIPTWMYDFYNLYIPAALGPYAMVAPYWDDLKGMLTGYDISNNPIFANMRICRWYDTANNRYIVEWNKAYNQYTIDLGPDASLEKFQLLIYAPQNNQDSELIFQYDTVDNPSASSNYSTVGIENHLQNGGLTYTYANAYPPTATPLQAGLAVKFTTDPPDHFVANEDNLMPDVPFQLHQNIPNPFHPATTIAYQMKINAPVKLEIFNPKGQLVKTLFNGYSQKGSHQLTWNGLDNSGKPVVSGIYLYKLTSRDHSETRKMMLMK